MNEFLCDTNVISELMRRRTNDNVANWAGLQEHFFISVVTVEEIHCGLEHQNLPKKEEWFSRFVRQCCTVLPVDEEVAKRAGKMRGSFLKRGITRTQADMFIGATALRNQMIVVSRNTADFEGCRVPVFNPFI